MAKIRVVMLILEYHPIVGGAQRQLALQVPRLQARDVEVIVLTRRYPGLAAQEIVNGVLVIRLPAPPPKLLAALLFSLTALWKLYKLRPDVIHAYSFLSPLTTAVTAKKLWGMPVVAKVLRGGLLGDIIRVQHKRFGLRRLAGYRQAVDAFITISQEIEHELADMGVPARQQVFIPNGVDVDRFCPVPANGKAILRDHLGLPTGLLVLFTGRLAPEKRLDRLIALWPTVRKKYPEAWLLLLGTGLQEAVLRQQAGEGVLFGGQVDDVVPYLQTADLFVLPSVSEGLSNALLEAMAVGLPVVVTAVGGAPDVVTHQESGWLVPPDDPDKITEAVTTLLANPDTRVQMGVAARKRIVEDFALEVVSDRLRELYDQVLAHTRQREPS